MTRPRSDDGASLLIVLVVLLVLSVVSLASLSVLEFAFRTGGVLHSTARAEQSAEAAVKHGIEELVDNPGPVLTGDPCSYPLTGVNGVSGRADCRFVNAGGSGNGYQSQVTLAAASTSTVTIARPSGAVAGDLLITKISYVGNVSPVSTLLGGWTAFPTVSQGQSIKQTTLWRRVGVVEPTSYTWVMTSPAGVPTPALVSAAVLRYGSVGDPTSLASNSGSSGDPSVLSSDTVAKDNYMVALYSVAASTALPTPNRSGDIMTERTPQQAAGLSSTVADYVQFNNGTGGTWSVNTSPQGPWAAQFLVLPTVLNAGLPGREAFFTGYADGQALVTARVSFPTATTAKVVEWTVREP